MAEEAKAPEEKEEAKAVEGEGEASAADAGKAKKKKMMMIASAALAVVGIGVAVGVVFFMGGSHEDKKAESGAAEEAKHIAVYDVPEFTLNLTGDDPVSQHFLKIKLAMELADEADAAAMEKLLPRLQDDWGGFLRQLRPADVQGSAALQRLKEGLLRRANQSLAPVVVRAVYIREMLVQ